MGILQLFQFTIAANLFIVLRAEHLPFYAVPLWKREGNLWWLPFSALKTNTVLSRALSNIDES